MKTSTRNVWQLVCLALWATMTVAKRPAIRFRTTEKGIDYAAKQVMQAFDLKGLTIPDYTSSKASVTGITIDNFVKPIVNAQIDADGLTITAQGAALDIVANWRYSIKVWFVRIRDSGTLRLRSAGIGFRITVKLGANQAGKPTIDFKECTANSGDFNSIRFSGTWLRWLYNTLASLLKKFIRRKADELICKQAEKAIGKVNQALQKQQVKSTVANKFTLDYGLTGNPSFGSDYMDLPIKGEFTWKAAPKSPPFQPDIIPTSSLKNKMVYIWGSDYVVNSFLYANYEENRLRYHGRIPVPGLSAPVDVSAVATKAPTFDITPGGIHIYAQGKARVGLGVVGNLTVNMGIVVTATPFISGHVLKATVNDIKSDITIASSTGIPLNNNQLNQFMEKFTDNILLPQINDVVGKGIDIPGFREISFERPVLTLNNGNLLIATDIKLTGLKL